MSRSFPTVCYGRFLPFEVALPDERKYRQSASGLLSVQKEHQTTRRNAMHLAVTPWLNRRPPSAGPKSDGLFCKLSLLFSCLRRSDASRAPSSGVCAAQPHTHQRILLQPGFAIRLFPLNTVLNFVQHRKLNASPSAPRLRCSHRNAWRPHGATARPKTTASFAMS